MKHRIRKLTSLLLSLSLISALTLPAAASNALGEDLSAKDTLLHQETQLSTNVFWSTTYSDLRTENLITYTPNKAVTPIVTYGDALTDRSSVADMAALLEDMAESKFALVAEGGSVPATHPLVRSGYAVLEAMAAHANSTHSYLDRNYFNDALTLLDDTRDAEELAKLKKMLNKF